MDDATRTLRTLRILWALLLADMVLIGAIAYVKMMHAGSPSLAGAQGGVIGQRQAYLYIAMLAGTMGAYFARMQFYKRHWRGDRVAPRGYFVGNVVLFAVINAVALASFVLYLTGHNILTVFFPGAAMTALMALNFPTGGPLTPYRSTLQ